MITLTARGSSFSQQQPVWVDRRSVPDGLGLGHGNSVAGWGKEYATGSIADLIFGLGHGSYEFDTGSAIVDGITNAGAWFSLGLWEAVTQVLDGIGSL